MNETDSSSKTTRKQPAQDQAPSKKAKNKPHISPQDALFVNHISYLTQVANEIYV